MNEVREVAGDIACRQLNGTNNYDRLHFFFNSTWSVNWKGKTGERELTVRLSEVKCQCGTVGPNKMSTQIRVLHFPPLERGRGLSKWGREVQNN